MSAYDIGDLAHLTVHFIDQATGDHIDPTSVALEVKDPSGFTDSKTPTHDSTGHYHFDLDLTMSGQWFYRWESTGTGQAAEEGSLNVRTSQF